MENMWESAKWRKSVISDTGGCVEVAFACGAIGVRDTKAKGAGAILEFNEREWRAFIEGARRGEFDYELLSNNE